LYILKKKTADAHGNDAIAASDATSLALGMESNAGIPDQEDQPSAAAK
jgi:hypothetical protein